MSIQHVQSTGVQSSGAVSSLQLAYTSNVKQGTLLVVGVVQNKSGGSGTMTISDSNVNSWSQAVTVQGGASSLNRASIFYAISNSAAACTITATPSLASTSVSMGISEYSGVDQNSPLGNTNSGTATSTAVSSGTVTITNTTTNSMLFGTMLYDPTATTIATGANFTSRYSNASATNEPVATADNLRIAMDQAVVFTLGASKVWTCCGAQFKPQKKKFLSGVQANGPVTIGAEAVNAVYSAYTQTADQNINTTATETSLAISGLGSINIPANFLAVGTTIHVKAWGFWSTKAVTPGTLAFKVRYGTATGGTIILSTGDVTPTAMGTLRLFSMEALITCRSTGVSGTLHAQGHVFLSAAANAASVAAWTWTMVNTAAITVDTTAATDLTPTAKWQTSDINNVVNCTNLTMLVYK